VPRLQKLGWSVVVAPGFAHVSVPVERWHLLIDPVTGAEQGRELVDVPSRHRGPLSALNQPKREGSFMVSLGIEVDGQNIDLAPLLFHLFKREPRWLKADEVALIPDD